MEDHEQECRADSTGSPESFKEASAEGSMDEPPVVVDIKAEVEAL